MSFLTCFWLLPQNEHFSRSPPSPMRATQKLLYMGPPGRPGAGLRRACPARPSCAPALTLPPRGRENLRQQPSNPVRGTPGKRYFRQLGRQYLGRKASTLERGQNLVDDAVLLGLIRGQELVPLDVLADGLF